MATNQNTLGASLPRLAGAARAIAQEPVTTVAWLLALAVAVVLTPIWGSAFVIMGWLAARSRMRTEGLAGLGEALAPSLARHQFRDGVWRGIWRAQKLGFAFALVQLPTSLLALTPAAIAFGLFAPTQATFGGALGLLTAYLVPCLVALACLVVILAESLVAYRILAVSGPDYSLGVVFRAVGAAWKATLAQASTLVGVTFGVLATALGVGIIVGGSGWLADLLELGGGVLIVVQWTGVVGGLFFVGLVLETLADWSDDVNIAAVPTGEHFSFSAWFSGWLQSAVNWFAGKGVVSVGLVLILALGVLTSGVALVTGQNLVSWVGLGWFAVTAAVLVMLQRQRSQA